MRLKFVLFQPAKLLLGNAASTKASTHGDFMKDEYDFSSAQRGKFYHDNAQLQLPVYLDTEVREYLSRRAKAKGVEVGTLVNDLLKRDIDLIETVK
jgi:hypothetical protein